MTTAPGTPSLPQAWLAAAVSGLDAARALRRQHPRSSASRSYYAAFAAAHAVMTHLRAWHRRRAHFKHGEVPAELRWTLLHDPALGFNKFTADVYQQQLEDAYAYRVKADYMPQVDLNSDEAGDAENAAANLVLLARRMLS